MRALNVSAELVPIWNKLVAYDLDNIGDALTFRKRLARDNGWSDTYSEQVINEYKRFLFLAIAAGHPVTPSDQVDQAWHLHLVYSYSYWEELCKDILGKPLHHGPTKGGESEQAKFEDWYTKTLDSYKRIYGLTPPASIWPDVKKRFLDINFLRVNKDNFWLLSKIKVIALLVFILCLIIQVLSVVAALVDKQAYYLVFTLAAFLVSVFTIIWAAKNIKSSSSGGQAIGGCSGGCGSDGGSGCGSGCGGCGGGGCGGCGG